MRVRLEGAIQALREVGEEFPEEHVGEAYRNCYRTCHEIRSRERDVTFMEQIEIFIHHIDDGLVARIDDGVVKRIAEIYADSLFHYPPPAHSDAVAVLKAVKEMGYAVGLISNTGMTPGYTFRRYMEQVGILEYFDVLAFSDELRLAKPSTEIFLHTARELGAQPQWVVHVGDHHLNDVVGAAKAGMKTIWIAASDEGAQEVDVRVDVRVRSLARIHRRRASG